MFKEKYSNHSLNDIINNQDAQSTQFDEIRELIMQNNKIKNIRMRSSALSSERHNLSRDVHTTFNFGEFQPTFIREMEADTSLSCDAETGALLAPMVVFTMGRLNLESYGMFVPTLDVFPCYKEYMTGTRFTYGRNTFVPLYRPLVLKSFLSLFCLIGANKRVG